MNNRICEMFGIEAPIFAFSHCRDVVVEASKAGGLGVLGTVRMDPPRLREALKWIDDHIGGKPYGIDVLLSSNYQEADGQFDPEHQFPKEYQFLRKLLDDAGVPPLPEAEAEQITRQAVGTRSYTSKETAAIIDIAWEHPIKLLVSALGSPKKDLVERAHARGMKVAALAGTPRHAIRHKQAGCDFVVAAGSEAGGHVGEITSMVLWPRVVDAVAPLPVLGAGGVGRGRQIAAALALGCEGVWCGSIWLKTVQSDLIPELKSKLFAAPTEDAVRTRAVTGKPCRTLRNAFTDAMDKPGAPAPLPAPLQAMLWRGYGLTRAERARASAFLTTPVGQIVEDMTEEVSTRQVFHEMLEELIESKERLDKFIG